MATKEKNSVWKAGWQVWLRLVFASIICFIVWFSIDAMGLSVAGEVSGYEIYEYDENGNNPQLVVSHTFTDDEDRSAEIKLDDNQVITKIRTMSPKSRVIVSVISSVFTWSIFALFPYNIMWNKGNRDENLVNIGRIDMDIAFGLKAGIVASIPSVALYCLLVLGKFGAFPSVILQWHRLINSPFIPYIDAVEMGVKMATQLSVGSLLAVGATLLFVPFVCWLGYYLGYRQISIRERLIYKKNNAK